MCVYDLAATSSDRREMNNYDDSMFTQYSELNIDLNDFAIFQSLIIKI